MIVARLIVLAFVAACRPAPPAEPVNAREATRPSPPRSGRSVVTDTRVEILGPIRFIGLSAALDAASTPLLDAIASTLAGNPSIRLVAVHAYGADGIAEFQGRIGQQRAEAIVRALVERGVDPRRLVAAGSGQPRGGGNGEPELEILARDP